VKRVFINVGLLEAKKNGRGKGWFAGLGDVGKVAEGEGI